MHTFLYWSGVVFWLCATIAAVLTVLLIGWDEWWSDGRCELSMTPTHWAAMPAIPFN